MRLIPKCLTPCADQTSSFACVCCLTSNASNASSSLCVEDCDEDITNYLILIHLFIYSVCVITQELGRAIHMAFFTWAPNAVLSKDCDEDITNYCLAARPNMASRPGAVGSCLANIVSVSFCLVAAF